MEFSTLNINKSGGGGHTSIPQCFWTKLDLYIHKYWSQSDLKKAAHDECGHFSVLRTFWLVTHKHSFGLFSLCFDWQKFTNTTLRSFSQIGKQTDNKPVTELTFVVVNINLNQTIKIYSFKVVLVKIIVKLACNTKSLSKLIVCI